MKLAGSKYMRIIEIRNYTMKCGYCLLYTSDAADD